MDTSGRYSSPALDAARGIPSITAEMTPLDVAAFLFDEAADLEESRLLSYVVRTPETGVHIRLNRQTVPWRQLYVPDGMTVTGVASTSVLEYGDIYDGKHGNRFEKYGTLLLASDHDNHAQWLWTEVWLPYGPRPIYRILSVEELAELMTTPRPGSRSGGTVLGADGLYEQYMNMIGHKLRFYRELATSMTVYAARTSERYRFISRMREPVDSE